MPKFIFVRIVEKLVANVRIVAKLFAKLVAKLVVKLVANVRIVLVLDQGRPGDTAV